MAGPVVRTFGRGLAVLLASLLAGGLVIGVAGTAQAGTCATSGPPAGGYAVTVCLTSPASGAILTGNLTTTATFSATGSAPALADLTFTLDGQYVLSSFFSPYSFTLPTAAWVDGPKSLAVYADMKDGFAGAPATVGVSFANGVTIPPVNTNTFTPSTGAPPAQGRPFVVAAAGDGADGYYHETDVSDLIASWNPNLFLYLGDVYERGSKTEFTDWYGSHNGFGRFRGITDPTIGNHEYAASPPGSGYFDYWDNAPHYYSVDVNGWHLVSLDSTFEYNGYWPESAQVQWLRQDLAASGARCTLVTFHHPRWSVGLYAPGFPHLQTIWQILADAGVDIVLSGHDHNYQRWVALDRDGNPSPTGVTQFVAGTGGHWLYPAPGTDPRLAAKASDYPDAYGALRLELNPDGAAFRFVNATGSVLDAGTLPCSGAGPDVTPPAAPTGLAATTPGPTTVALSWTPATDNVGVMGYDVLRNGGVIGSTTTATSFSDTSVVAGATYTYTVVARDAAGNVSPAGEPVTVAPTATLFVDGFESGSLGAWSQVSGLVVQQQEVLSGSYAARATGAGTAAYAIRSLSSTQPEVYARVRFKIVTQSTAVSLVKLRTSSSTSLVGVFVSSAGKLGVSNYVSNPNGVDTVSTTSVSKGAWHEVQIRARIDGAAGETEVWLDGSRVGDLSRTDALGTTPIGKVQLGENWTGRTYDVAFDDLAAGLASLLDHPPTASAVAIVAQPGASTPWTPVVADPDGDPMTCAVVTPPAHGSATVNANCSGGTYTSAAGYMGPDQFTYQATDAAGLPSGPASVGVTVAGGTVFGDGFESGSLSAWTLASGLQAQSASVHTGTFAAEGDTKNGATWARADLPTTYGDLYARAWVRFGSMGKKGVTVLSFMTAGGGTGIASLYAAPDLRLGLRNERTGAGTLSSARLPTNGWAWVELRVVVNGAASTTQVWLNGALIGSLALTTNLGTSPVGSLRIGEPGHGPSYHVFVDDVAVATTLLGAS